MPSRSPCWLTTICTARASLIPQDNSVAICSGSALVVRAGLDACVHISGTVLIAGREVPLTMILAERTVCCAS